MAKKLTFISTFFFCVSSLAFARQPSYAPATTPATATSKAGSQIMATVNGQPIYMDDLNEILLYSYGMPVAQQLVANELVRQEAQRKNVSVTDEEVKAEHERTLVQLFPEVTEPGQREKGFQEFLVRRSVTRKQWDFTMTRNALLARLAQPQIKITEADLRKAFGDLYGRRVVVRHIQVASVNQAQEVLDQLKAGADFAELAQKKSTSPTRVNGGLMPTISSTTTEISPAIKEAALAMSEVGEISPAIQSGTAFHILRLEKILEPDKVKFEDVKDDLQTQVHLVKVQQLSQQLLMELIRKGQETGQIQYKNPVLQNLNEEAIKEAQQQNAGR